MTCLQSTRDLPGYPESSVSGALLLRRHRRDRLDSRCQPLPAGHRAFTSMLNAPCIIVSPTVLRCLFRAASLRGRTGTRDIYRGNRTQFSRTAEASAPSEGRRNLGVGGGPVKNYFGAVSVFLRDLPPKPSKPAQVYRDCYITGDARAVKTDRFGAVRPFFGASREP